MVAMWRRVLRCKYAALAKIQFDVPKNPWMVRMVMASRRKRGK
jgi:hypothetical protein